MSLNAAPGRKHPPRGKDRKPRKSRKPVEPRYFERLLDKRPIRLAEEPPRSISARGVIGKPTKHFLGGVVWEQDPPQAVLDAAGACDVFDLMDILAAAAERPEGPGRPPNLEKLTIALDAVATTGGALEVNREMKEAVAAILKRLGVKLGDRYPEETLRNVIQGAQRTLEKARNKRRDEGR